MKKVTTLKRAINAMPQNIQQALIKNGLTKTYKDRPPYQQNDYIGWITRAKLKTTQQKRLNQMLEELKNGDSYMKMAWKPRM